jgi:hypothetical protein
MTELVDVNCWQWVWCLLLQFNGCWKLVKKWDMSFHHSDFMLLDKPFCRRKTSLFHALLDYIFISIFMAFCARQEIVFYMKNVCQKMYKLLLCFLLGMVIFFSWKFYFFFPLHRSHLIHGCFCVLSPSIFMCCMRDLCIFFWSRK